MIGRCVSLVLVALAACEPSDEEYINVVRAGVAQNCCSFGKDGCKPCPLLEGAHLTTSSVAPGAAANGRQVTVGVDGPHGPGTCRFSVGRMSSSLAVGGGGCEAK